MSRDDPHDEPGRGYSLVHLVLILVALSGTACLLVPGWFERQGVTLDNAATLLASDLRDAQNRAAFEHRPLRVTFHAGGDGYDVTDSFGGPLSAPVGDGPFERHYSRDGVFRGVTFEAVRLGPDRSLEYGPRGLVVHGGEIVLAFRGETRTVRVTGPSGHIEIDGLTTAWEDSDY